MDEEEASRSDNDAVLLQPLSRQNKALAAIAGATLKARAASTSASRPANFKVPLPECRANLHSRNETVALR